MIAEIFGVDGIIVVIVVVLVLFGSSQIPKLARSLGSAQKEFKSGLQGGSDEANPVVEDATGKAKERVGALVGNDELRREGETQQDKADALRLVADKETDEERARADRLVERNRPS